MDKFPKDDQDALMAFFGDPGAGEVAAQLVPVVPPFKFTYEGKPFPRFMIHKKAAPAFARALQKIWDYVGHDQALLDRLRVSTTAGSYNPRKVRGSDTKWSNHAFGGAVDVNSEQNGFGEDGSRMPKFVVAAFKSEGFSWGGDYKSRKDPMHFEACDRGEPEMSFEGWLAHYGLPLKMTEADAAVEAKVTQRPAAQVARATQRLRDKMADLIVGYEARRDSAGHLAVYRPSDGSFEVAGINSTYHPDLAGELRALVEAGSYGEAEEKARAFVLQYTNFVAKWADDAGLEYLLRDCAYNRGPGGAAAILQRALGVTADGHVGEETLGAVKTADPDALLARLRAAREWYEDKQFGARPALRPGLVSRWNKSLEDARKLRAEAKSVLGPVIVAAGTVVAGGGVGSVVVSDAAKEKIIHQGIGWQGFAALALIAAIVLLIAAKVIYNRVSKP